MALGGPNIFPSVLTWLNVQRELTAGSISTLPAATLPLDQGSFEPEDTPKFLQDKAIRGAMTDLFYETLGVESATFSFGGPSFLDAHGYFFDNVFGDLSTTAANLSATLATITSGGTIGSTQLTFSAAVPASMTAGSYVQLGTYPSTVPSSYINEMLQVSTTGTSTISFNQPLRFAHPSVLSGATVSGSSLATQVAGANTQYTHRFAALNSNLGYGGAYGAQPPTHTFTDITNIVQTLSNPTYGTYPTNTYGARAYPFSCLKNIDFSGNAEQLLNIKSSGDGFLSTIATSAQSVNLANPVARPIPNWASTVYILGQTVPTTDIGEFSVSFKRMTQVYWTVQGQQQPFVIARGPLTMDGTLQYDPAVSEAPLDMMLLNAQGPMSIVMTNANIPNSGTPFTLTFTASQVANIKSKVTRSKDLVSFQNSYEGVANATDIGGSGGLGPGTITLVNGTATY